MKRITLLAVAVMAFFALTAFKGCAVSTSQRQQIANALDNTTIVIKDAQQAEIVAVNNNLIPPTDDIFVQKELIALSQLGKTTDACVLSAVDTTTSLACLKNELTTIKQIQADGALSIKSDKAQASFNTVMNSILAVVNSVYTTLGGK